MRIRFALFASVLLAAVVTLSAIPRASAEMMPYPDVVDSTGKHLTLKELEAQPKKNADGTIQLNNARCPVSGGAAVPALAVVHENLVYFVADKRAYVRFRKNPAKYALDEKVKA